MALALFLALVSGSAAQAQSSDDALRLGPLGILTREASVLDVGAGVYDLIGNAHRNETSAADAELRLGRRWGGIGPAVGTIVDFRGGGMGYVGIDSDLALGPVVVTPLLGLGAWWRGGNDDENLGGTFQFRLSLEAAYAFAGGSRLGVRFGHISNGDIHKVNPGENDVMVTYGLPLGL
ncbi:MAG TPA: acyloxyacyl hydrolase [Stellaceae bacterium]|nr:acyloxyacyl hydrolase [Stellaceae bacterium]